MNGIHRQIKQLRSIKEFTQQDMADKLGMSLKAYQNFENGITKLDYERLKSVAQILEVEIEDLINAEDSGVYIAEIKNNSVGYNGSTVTIHNPETKGERDLFEKIIASKDEQILLLTKTNETLQNLLNEFRAKR